MLITQKKFFLCFFMSILCMHVNAFAFKNLPDDCDKINSIVRYDLESFIYSDNNSIFYGKNVREVTEEDLQQILERGRQCNLDKNFALDPLEKRIPKMLVEIEKQKKKYAEYNVKLESALMNFITFLKKVDAISYQSNSGNLITSKEEHALYDELKMYVDAFPSSTPDDINLSSEEEKAKKLIKSRVTEVNDEYVRQMWSQHQDLLHKTKIFKYMINNYPELVDLEIASKSINSKIDDLNFGDFLAYIEMSFGGDVTYESGMFGNSVLIRGVQIDNKTYDFDYGIEVDSNIVFLECKSVNGSPVNTKDQDAMILFLLTKPFKDYDPHQIFWDKYMGHNN